MKKYLFAALGAGLLMTSCQSDEPLAPGNGTVQQVAFTVSLPDAVSTRAAGGTNSALGGVSNNMTADVTFNVALYLDGRLVFADNKTVQSAGNGTSATFEPTLVIGENYQLVAFAEFDDDATATGQGVNPQTNMGLIAMESGINNELNDEYFVSTTLTAAPELSATLKRPYGKLRLIAEDLAEAERQFGAKVKSVEVTYKHTRPTNFNVIAGTFDPAYTEGAQTFAAAYGEYTDETAGTDRTIFVDYLPGKFDGSESMVPFTVKVIFANGKTYTRDFNQDIPVKRNYLTTLKGRLFTMDSELKLTIEEAFVDEIEINFAEDLEWVAANGGTVNLTEDITLTKALNVTKDMVINLNGHTISAANAKGDGAVIEVAEGVSAKLVGGTIENTTPNGDAAINNAGELVLENITIEGAPLADGGYSAYAVISSGKLTIGEGVNVSADRGCLKFSGDGETVINGGNFTNKDIGSRNLTSHVVDVEDGGSHKLTINGGTFAHLHTATSGGVVICNRTTGTVYVNGGNFSGGNYYGNDNLSDYGYGGTFVVTGGTYSAKPAAKYIAAGYKALKVDKLYYILPEAIADAAGTANVTTVTESTSDFATAIATDNGEGTLFMWNDVAYIAEYGNVNIVASEEGKTTVRGIVEELAAVKEANVVEGIEVVGNRTFRKCKELTTVALPNTLTEIGPAVFQSCSKLANVTIPANVKTIGEGAFAECTSLTSINIPNGITRLEKDVLRNTGLTSIEIPASVTYIGTYAFRDCESLTEVKILSPEFTIENNTFTNMAAPVPTMTIYVVNAEKKAYLDSVLTNYDKYYITVVVM